MWANKKETLRRMRNRMKQVLSVSMAQKALLVPDCSIKECMAMLSALLCACCLQQQNVKPHNSGVIPSSNNQSNHAKCSGHLHCSSNPLSLPARAQLLYMSKPRNEMGIASLAMDSGCMMGPGPTLLGG